MCTVLLTSLRRVLSTFVLVCFLWTTLFQSFAFAGYERTFGDPTLIEQRGDTHFAHFSVGFQKMEDVPTQNDPALHAQFFPKKSPTLIIPIVRNEARSELLFDQAFSDTTHILPTVVDGGLSFASGELDFYRENTSGDLVVSKTDVPHAVRSSPLHIYNDHGSTILDTDLPLDHLILSGKDVIQRGKQDIASLLLGIQGRFLNQEKFSVGKLIFDSVLSDISAETSRESSRAPSPAFSTHSGVSTASSHSLGFANESNMTVREETAFGLAYPIQNSGTWVFHKDVTYSDDILLNETDTSVMEYHQALKGTLHTLHNQGDFHVHGGFDDLQIQEFSNSGTLHGRGQLTLGTHEDDEDLLSINTGHIHTDQLALDLVSDFENRGTIQADTHLHTHGDVTFYQRGTLSGKAITINNRSFLNEASVDNLSLDLTFDENVETFHNAEDVTLATQSLTFARSVHDATKLVNEGTINTKRFANAQNSLTNKHQITVDVWDQRGKAVTNAPGGMIDVVHNAHFETDQMDNGGDVTLAHASGRLDHLTNIGGFTVQSGGLTFKTLRNDRTMRLLDGEYHIDHLDNTGGEATIDQLVLTSESPTLNGTLTVHHMKPTRIPYTHITVDGTVDLQSGGFTTKALSLKGTLTLEKGRYHIDRFTGDKGAKLILKRGATVVIGNTEYDGDVISEVRLDLNLTHDKNASHVTALRRDYTARKTAFNALPTATPLKKPILEETVFDTTKRINDAMSDYHRFDPTRSCDLNELQSRFKMRMGTEVTRIIYEPHRRDALDIQKTLPVLPSTDKLFGHFEITRLSSKVSHDIIQKITTDGMDILDSLSFYVPSFDADFGVIKRYRHDLTRDMFMLWLRDVLDEHDEGFTPYKFLKPSVLPPPPPPPTETKQKTFRAPQSRPGNVTDLLKHHKERETAFNDVLKETSTATTSVLEKAVLTASSNIVGILGQVSSRQATDHEKKSILQTVMGSEITKVLHNETNQSQVDLETHLPTVDKAHWSYRHFEILRLTAKVSRLLVQQVSGHGYDALSYVSTLLPEFDVDTDTLCTYSGIKRDLFLLWFREILEQHEEGFNHVTRASLTFLSPHTSRSGTIRAAKHVTLTASPDTSPEWAADFLKTHKDTLKIDVRSGLTIATETFLNPHELNLPYPLYISGAFINHRILRTKGLFQNGSFFQNGTDNDHMGTIECDGLFHTESRIRFDNRFGMIEAMGDGWIKSHKEFLNGYYVEYIEETAETSSSIGNHIIYLVEKHKKRNGSKILIKGKLYINANGNINNNYGLLFGRSETKLNTEGIIYNKTGLIYSEYRIFIESEELLNSIGSIIKGDRAVKTIYDNIGTGRSHKIDMYIQADYFESKRAEIQSTGGEIYIHVKKGENKGSFIGSPLAIYINGSKINTNKTSIPSYFKNVEMSVNLTRQNHINYWGDPSTITRETIPGSIKSGQYIDIQTDLFSMTGDADAPVFKLNTSYFEARGIYYHVDNRSGGVFFSVTDHARSKVLENNPLYAQTEHGVHLSIKDDARPHTYNPELFTSLTPHSKAPYRISPSAFEFIRQSMLFDLLGRLHYKGLSGRPLGTYLSRIGTKQIKQLHASGIDTSDQLAVQDHFLTSVDAAIFCREREYENGRVFNDTLMYLSPAMAKELVQGAVVQATQIDIQNEHHMTMTNGAKLVVEEQKTDLDLSLLDEDVPEPEVLEPQFNVVTGSLFGEAAGFIAPRNTPICLTVKGNVVFIPKIKRRATANGFVEEIEMSKFKGGDIFINADGVFDVTAIMMDAEKTIQLSAKQIIDRQALLYWQSHSITHTDDGSISICSHGANATVSRYFAREHIILESDSTIDVFGTFFKSKLIQLFAEEDVRVHDVHDTVETSITQKSEDDSLFGGTTTTHSSFASSTSKRAVFDGKLQVVTREGNVDFRNIDARNGIDVIAPNGVVRFLLGENTTQSSFQEQSKDMLWQSLSYELSHDKTYSQSRIQGMIHILSKETIVQDVQGQTAEFLARIEQDGGKITREFLTEIHERMADEKGGPTATFAIIIAIAASVCTAGAGSTASAALVSNGIIAANGLAAAAVTTIAGAGITSLTTQAALALVTNQGDIFKAAESLANSGTLKTVATDIAFAALLGTPSSGASIGTHVMHQIQNSFVRMGVEGAIHGRTDRKAWFKKAMLEGVAAYATSNIGAMNRAATIDQVSHKIAHAFVQGMKGKLMYGNKAIAPAMIGGFVSECIAEFMMPTHGTDKRAAHERPDYTKSQQAIVHGIAKLAPVLICAACGMNDAQISVAVNAATMALAYNHGQSVDEARKKSRANEADEEEKEDDNPTPKTTSALTINGAEFDLMDHQPSHPGLRKRSLSLTSLYLAEKKEQARADYRAAKTSAEKDIALSRALNADIELANRPIVKTTHQTIDYIRDNPGKTSAYIGATLLSGGAVLAPNLPAGIFLGAAGGFIGSMASHDFSINSGKDAASIAVSTALGGLIPAPAKLFFPAALATGVYGMSTHDSDLMWEGGLGAAFSFVPLVKEVRHSFNTGKNITVGGAHFSRSLDDSMLRPPVNSNVPIKPTANTNVMPLPHVVEPIEVNGLQKLAQELSGGAKTTKDYRQIYFSAERSRAQGLGSNGTLTMDGGTRTLNASKAGSGKLVLDSSGNSGSLGVFRQNAEGRWLLSAGERVSAKDLGQRPIDLIETTERTLASWERVKLDKLKDSLLKGEYGKVKGHHVHAKKAFEGHANYDPKKGFSISDELMRSYGIKHSTITGAQQRLFNELYKSNRPNTIYEHTRIAVEALVEAGMQKDAARNIVAESLSNLRMMNVRHPMNIPWN